MSRKTNITNYIITMAAMLGALFLAVYVCNLVYGGDIIDAAIQFLVGAIIAGFVHTAAHELAHLIVGKKNGFAFSSITIWFFKWSKIRNKIRFDLTMIGEEAGYTEMIPTSSDNLSRRFVKMTSAGYIASLIFTIIGLPAIFLALYTDALNVWVYCIWVMFLPIGVYFTLGTALPASSYGVRNDGAVVYGIKKDDDESKVTLAVLDFQAQMYSGKTPSEVDEELLFNVPQLPEDSITFAILLNSRYMYYLDKGDYANAKKTTERLISLEEYMPKYINSAVKVDALYNACTFDFNEETADDIVYEIEKYLNNVNTASSVRAKLAYLIYVRREKENLDMFFKKGFKEADRCQISGLGKFERKLFEKMQNDCQTVDTDK